MNIQIFNRNIRLYVTEREIQAIVQERYYCRLFVVREEHLDLTSIGPHSCPTYPCGQTIMALVYSKQIGVTIPL